MKNIIMSNNGDLIITYKLKLLEKYSLSEGEYDQINEELNLALKDIEENIIYFKQDLYTQKKFNYNKLPDDSFLQKSYKKYWSNYNYIDDETLLFFIKKNKNIKKEELTNPFKIPKKNNFIEFDEKSKEFISEIETVIQRISRITLLGKKKIEIQPFDENDFSNYCDFYLAGMTDIFVDIKKEWEYLRIGNQYVSILTFPKEVDFPKQSYACIKDAQLSTDKSIFFKNYGDNFGLNLKFNHIYNQIGVFQDNNKILKIAEKNKEEFYKARRFNSYNETKAKKIEQEINEIIENKINTRFIKAHNNIIIFANNEKQLEERISIATNQIKETGIKPKRIFGDNLLAVYLYCCPLYTSNLVENHFYLSTLDNFLAYNILTSKSNEDKEGIYFNSRIDNTPTLIDMWDEKGKYIKARNFMIISPTGYGKSFTALHIINTYLSQGYKIVIIDLGNSYKNLSLLNKNKCAYITYEEGQALGINPFDIPENKENKLILKAEKIEQLTDFIMVHYRRDQTPTIQERATIRKIIPYYYINSNKDKNFPNFIEFCNQEKKNIIKDLNVLQNHFDFEEYLLLINEFGLNGVYNFLYDNKNKSIYGKEIFEKDLIIFELEKIQSNQLLLLVILQLINVTIDEIILKDTSIRSLVLCDEVAKQIQWEGMAKSIEYLYQTARKKLASIGIILQTIAQLPERYKAIIENTSILYILYSKDYELLKDKFGFSDHATYLLSSLQDNTAANLPYSEIFISRGLTQQVYRLAVDRKTFWAFQTDGKRNAFLMNIYNKTNDMEKTINYIVQEEKQGKLTQI